MRYAGELERLRAEYVRILGNEIRHYRDVLATLRSVYRLLPERPKRPLTIPAIFRKSYDENFVSDYLAYAIDPAMNGVGVAPVARLLTWAGADIESAQVDSADVHREYDLRAGGRIDLLAVINKELVLGIENKIFSSEGDDQTGTYSRAVKSRFDGLECWFLFLTREGMPASSRAFKPISYRQMHDIFRSIPYDWSGDIRSSVIWEDFLAHLEVLSL